MRIKQDRHKITEREIQVIKEVCKGLSNPEIARILHITPDTVRGHLAHIYDKLNIEGGTNQKRIKLVVIAIKKNYF